MATGRASLCPIVFILAIIILSGCRGPSEPELLFAPGTAGPVVTGLLLIDPEGRLCAVWGQPSEPSDPTGAVQLAAPYPNPVCMTCTVRYAVRAPARMKAWVVSAVRPGQSEQNFVYAGNSTLFVLRGMCVRTFFDESKAVGVYSMIWDGSTDAGQELASGFYRIYLQTADVTLWRDIFYARRASDIPPELRALCTWCM